MSTRFREWLTSRSNNALTDVLQDARLRAERVWPDGSRFLSNDRFSVSLCIVLFGFTRELVEEALLQPHNEIVIADRSRDSPRLKHVPTYYTGH